MGFQQRPDLLSLWFSQRFCSLLLLSHYPRYRKTTTTKTQRLGGVYYVMGKDVFLCLRVQVRAALFARSQERHQESIYLIFQSVKLVFHTLTLKNRGKNDKVQHLLSIYSVQSIVLFCTFILCIPPSECGVGIDIILKQYFKLANPNRTLCWHMFIAHSTGFHEDIPYTCCDHVLVMSLTLPFLLPLPFASLVPSRVKEFKMNKSVTQSTFTIVFSQHL